MCRSRRGRRRCVFTFWEKGGGEEFSGQTLVAGGAGWEIYASSSSFGLPPFFPLFCYLVSQASSPSSSSSSFRIFISSFLRFAMEDGKGKETTPAASPSSSVPSLRAKKKLSLPLPLLHSIRLFFRSFFFSDGGGGPPPPLSPPRPVPRLRHIFHLCQKEGEGGGLGHLTASSPSSSFFDGGGGSPSLLATLLLHPDP